MRALTPVILVVLLLSQSAFSKGARFQTFSEGNSRCVISSSDRMCCDNALTKEDLAQTRYAQTCAESGGEMVPTSVAKNLHCNFSTSNEEINGTKWECKGTKAHINEVNNEPTLTAENSESAQPTSFTGAEIPLDLTTQISSTRARPDTPTKTQGMESYPFPVGGRKSWKARPFDESHPLAHCTHYDGYGNELGLGGLTRDQKLAKIYKGGRIVIHHSEGWSGARSMQSWHLDGNGWEDLGYHFVIELDGSIRQGRDLMDMGRHAGQPPGHKKACEEKTQFWLNEDYDYKSIGIVLVGSYVDEPTGSKKASFNAQLESLKKLVLYLAERYKITRVQGHQHYRFGGTSCPGKYFEGVIKSTFSGLLDTSPQVGRNGPLNEMEPRLLCRVPDGCGKLK